MRKGRQKFTLAQIAEMRSLLASGETDEEVATAYGASVKYVGRIRRGEVRRKAGGPLTRFVAPATDLHLRRELAVLRKRVAKQEAEVLALRLAVRRAAKALGA